MKLVFCASGICVCYWLYGALQEALITDSNLGAIFLLAMQSVANMIVAFLWSKVDDHYDNKDKQKIRKSFQSLNHPLLFVTSVTYLSAMVCTNEALRFVSYPSAVLIKSCKMIPTMLMGYIVEKQEYSIRQWMSAFLISIGIALFNLSRIQEFENESQKSNEDYWKGMLLLFTSLCMDGLLGSFQGMLKSLETPPNANESMFFVNFYAFLLSVPLSVVSGQWTEGVLALKENPDFLKVVCLLNGVVSVGQIFIFLTLTWYSSLVCTTITTTRKFFTILFSVIYFGHAFSVWQWASVLMVFSGLYLSMGASTRTEKERKKKED